MSLNLRQYELQKTKSVLRASSTKCEKRKVIPYRRRPKHNGAAKEHWLIMKCISGTCRRCRSEESNLPPVYQDHIIGEDMTERMIKV